MEPLRNIGLEVVELFERVDKTIDKGRYESLKVGFAGEANSFQNWAANHYLFASADESLDYRLRDARGRDMREALLESMKGLSGYLQEVVHYFNRKFVCLRTRTWRRKRLARLLKGVHVLILQLSQRSPYIQNLYTRLPRRVGDDEDNATGENSS